MLLTEKLPPKPMPRHWLKLSSCVSPFPHSEFYECTAFTFSFYCLKSGFCLYLYIDVSLSEVTRHLWLFDDQLPKYFHFTALKYLRLLSAPSVLKLFSSMALACFWSSILLFLLWLYFFFLVLVYHRGWKVKMFYFSLPPPYPEFQWVPHDQFSGQ